MDSKFNNKYLSNDRRKGQILILETIPEKKIEKIQKNDKYPEILYFHKEFIKVAQSDYIKDINSQLNILDSNNSQKPI